MDILKEQNMDLQALQSYSYKVSIPSISYCYGSFSKAPFAEGTDSVERQKALHSKPKMGNPLILLEFKTFLWVGVMSQVWVLSLSQIPCAPAEFYLIFHPL